MQEVTEELNNILYLNPFQDSMYTNSNKLSDFIKVNETSKEIVKCSIKIINGSARFTVPYIGSERFLKNFKVNKKINKFEVYIGGQPMYHQVDITFHTTDISVIELSFERYIFTYINNIVEYPIDIIWKWEGQRHSEYRTFHVYGLITMIIIKSEYILNDLYMTIDHQYRYKMLLSYCINDMYVYKFPIIFNMYNSCKILQIEGIQTNEIYTCAKNSIMVMSGMAGLQYSL